MWPLWFLHDPALGHVSAQSHLPSLRLAGFGFQPHSPYLLLPQPLSQPQCSSFLCPGPQPSNAPPGLSVRLTATSYPPTRPLLRHKNGSLARSPVLLCTPHWAERSALLNPIPSCEVGPTSALIFQMKQYRHRDSEELTQGHSWWAVELRFNRGWGGDPPPPPPRVFPSLHIPLPLSFSNHSLDCITWALVAPLPPSQPW